ncbi:TetR family transcriptional regulator C-terminal domain-containing protein [Amycolatopsis sp., V23-08]|uniref:TetR family transcriptional regulator C-terminal domain-containing protein n=1 Tax=Amycolatopsis heterodermiae TaxID=3110235 RepID=A0ABU5RAR9_9PSEU|nr:TetR family transcriptional regulator C-terminal domain-containing protein [Amycolatopsis sp., V23-08]MEA5362346.1 TetR family transcriptional regulator C-terminal domain-containing protein [Amycolatopsis sp., V23-08]
MRDEDGAGDQPGRARSYRKAEERREQVLAKAIELFARDGVETSLRSIGESIGVSHAALRYYFPSRDDLLIAVYQAHEAAEDEEDADSATAVLKRSAVRNREVPGLVELYATLTTDALQPDRHPAVRDFVWQRFRRVRAQLAEMVREGQSTDVDADDAAALLVAASDGLQVQWLLDPEAVDVHRVLSLLERLVLGSARPREGGETEDGGQREPGGDQEHQR